MNCLVSITTELINYNISNKDYLLLWNNFTNFCICKTFLIPNKYKL